MTTQSFGIDIGEKYTRIVDLSYENGKINLLSMGTESTVPNFFSDDTEKSIENQSEVVAKLCSDLKIIRKKANFVIPDSQSFSQILEFAKLNEKELLSAVRYQADQFIPMSIDEVVLDIEILKDDKVGKKNTILIVASPKKIVDRIEKVADMAGLIPDSLENELSSFGRFFSEIMNIKMTGTCVAVNFGYSSTSLYLIDGQTSLILLTRTVKIGFDLFIKELRFNFELQESKAIEVLRTLGFEKNTSYDIPAIVSPLLKELLGEISKIIIHSKEKYARPVAKIFIFNHNNNILSMDKKLSEILSLPVESLLIRELLINNPVSQSFSLEMPSYICAIGNSLR
jgi:type IV pilus assembly protein PilM